MEDIVELKEFTVVFKDEVTDEIIKKEIVYEGGSAKAPEPLEHDGYKFSKWDVDFTNVKKDLVVTAIYKKKKPIVLWIFFGLVIFGGIVALIFVGLKYNWFDFLTKSNKNKDLFIIEGNGKEWEIGQNIKIFESAKNHEKYIDLYYNINVDIDNDGICDINCDINDDGIPDYNIDWKGDLKPHFNVDNNKDQIGEVNERW